MQEFKPSAIRSFIRDFININNEEPFVKNISHKTTGDELKRYSEELINSFQHEFINKQNVIEGLYEEDELTDEFIHGENINIF